MLPKTIVAIWALFILVATSQCTIGQEHGTVIDSEHARASVSEIAVLVAENYFDVEVGEKVACELQQQLLEGRFDKISSSRELAETVTASLYRLTNDKHLAAVTKNASEVADLRKTTGKSSNFGFQRIEILDGNIGYINVTAFYRASECQHLVAAAMAFLSNADALIVDLRENTGGSPESVALLASYFFADNEKLLFKIVDRSGASREFTTVPDVEQGNAERPVVVLTGPITFSAGEGFAYLMQDQDRALVVGSNTAGAANPGRRYLGHGTLDVIIPNGKVVMAVGKDNWEGNGVIPDVMATADEALEVGVKVLLQKCNDALINESRPHRGQRP